jgi:hypothetical protein
VAAALAALGALAVWYVSSRGYTLYYGDAEAHLNIARRIVDSRTPGYEQIGTVWLPLPHLLMLPLVGYDRLWHTGLAGAIPSAACFVAGGTFLFAAARRVFGSVAAGTAAAALIALNPNLLYLQATPMTEPMFLAPLMALLYFTVRYGQTRSAGAAIGAGIAALAGTLMRYEGWFLLPFAAVFILIAGRRRGLLHAALFSAIAALGPLSWMAHNWWLYSDPLAFYRGPYSAKAIQGAVSYPGKDDWPTAWLYFRTAARLCAGWPLLGLALAGGAVLLLRRAVWPVLFLLLVPVFYIWSMHSSGTPIFVPELWPNSYYNTRYGLALLPAAAIAAAALVTLAPARFRAAAAVLVVAAASLPWLLRPSPEACITWKESQVNSVARRAWTREAAEFLGARYRRGDGVITSFGDLTGIFRTLRLPLRETLTGDNGPHWMGAVARPDLFLWEQWAVVTGGDPVQTAINRARLRGPHYTLARTIIVKGAPVIEIYRRELVPNLK